MDEPIGDEQGLMGVIMSSLFSNDAVVKIFTETLLTRPEIMSNAISSAIVASDELKQILTKIGEQAGEQVDISNEVKDEIEKQVTDEIKSIQWDERITEAIENQAPVAGRIREQVDRVLQEVITEKVGQYLETRLEDLVRSEIGSQFENLNIDEYINGSDDQVTKLEVEITGHNSDAIQFLLNSMSFVKKVEERDESG